MSKHRHYIALFVSLFFFGLSFPAIKSALASNDWFSLLYMRFLFATIFIFPYLFQQIRKSKLKKSIMKIAILIAASNVFGMALQTAGMELTEASKSAILTQLIIVFVPFLSYLLIGERIYSYQILAALLSISGAVILSTNLQFQSLNLKGSLVGDLLIIAANFFWALFIVFSKKAAVSASPLVMQALNIVFSFLFLNFLLPFKAITIDFNGVMAAIFLAIACTIIPTALFFFALKKVSATTSAIIGPFEVISALLVSMIILKERLDLYEILGAIIIISSIYLILLNEILCRSQNRLSEKTQRSKHLFPDL